MRTDQYQVTVTVDGQSLGRFDTFAGGEADSEETKYKAAGVREVSLGGRATLSNITVGRLYTLERDHELARRLMGRTGRAPVTVVKQPLDADDNPWGAPFVYQGTLKRVKAPDSDSTRSESATMELEVTTVGVVG